MKINHLQLWIDDQPRSPAEQMALDEALFLQTQSDGIARLRCYQWQAAAVTIGYFDTYPTDETRPVIRRLTGGGLVEHGQDLTFCLTLPKPEAAAKASTEERYHWIHSTYSRASQGTLELQSADDAATAHGPCFTTPVTHDLLDAEGRKLVGGAQRRSRGHVIHQGSSYADGLDLAEAFAIGLATEVQSLDPSIIDDSVVDDLIITRYDCETWNLRR